MESDPSVFSTHLEEGRPLGFPVRLLQVGETKSIDNQHGQRVFKVIEEMFPVESQIYSHAIDELLDRLEVEGVSEPEVADAGNHARLLLGLTLVPFIRAFVEEFLQHNRQPPEDESIEYARNISRPWAIAQLKRCVTYTIALRIRDHQRHLRHGGFDQLDVERMQTLKQILDQHGDRPEAGPLVEKTKQEYQRLAESMAGDPVVNSVRPRALTYLLGCTSEGQLRDMALAALILKGNSSLGAEAVANPLQLLDVGDVASVLGLEKSAVTSNVSKLRSKACKHDRVANVRPELHPRHLWVHVTAQQARPAETAGTNKDSNYGQ